METQNENQNSSAPSGSPLTIGSFEPSKFDAVGSLLYDAASAGDLAAVKDILKTRWTEIDDTWFERALMCAAVHCDEPVTTFLLNQAKTQGSIYHESLCGCIEALRYVVVVEGGMC